LLLLGYPALAEPAARLAWSIDSPTNIPYAITVGDDGTIYSTHGSFLHQGAGNVNRLMAVDKAGHFLWSAEAGENSGSNDSNTAHALSGDNDGNIYLAGAFRGGALTVGGVSNTSQWPADQLFVAKLNSAGEAVWLTNTHGHKRLYAQNIGTDDVGNVYVSGTLEGEEPGEYQ
jgi:hypothetical protein